MDALFAGIAEGNTSTDRSRMAELILTRLLGKPKDTVELQTNGLDEVREMTAEQLDTLRRQLLDAHPHLRVVEG